MSMMKLYAFPGLSVLVSICCVLSFPLYDATTVLTVTVCETSTRVAEHSAVATGTEDTEDWQQVSSNIYPEGGTYRGDITYYDPGLGSCGLTNSPGDFIVAASSQFMDPHNPTNPNNNPMCGKKVKIYGMDQTTAEIKTVEATIVDTCPGCNGMYDLDGSRTVFNATGCTDMDGSCHISWFLVNI